MARVFANLFIIVSSLFPLSSRLTKESTEKKSRSTEKVAVYWAHTKYRDSSIMFSRKNIKNFFTFTNIKTIYRMALLMYAKFAFNVVYYAVINPLGYCLTVSIMIYGVEGLTGQDSMVNSQLFALSLFGGVFHEATLVLVILSIPSPRDLLYQEFGKEYVRSYTGSRPSLAITKVGMALLCLGVVEWGATTCKNAYLSASLDRSFETLETLRGELQQKRSMEIESIDAGVSPDVRSLLVDEILEKYDKITDLEYCVHGEMSRNIMGSFFKHKSPLYRLVSFIKEFLGW
ncbi:MAG: hypothetical protein EOP45_19745 [Sphingobacteriaceae bacterium]|nr:MAG: hypothetical protein EOP45_19745 [Sphingobacteriaceae bacterium]